MIQILSVMYTNSTVYELNHCNKITLCIIIRSLNCTCSFGKLTFVSLFRQKKKRKTEFITQFIVHDLDLDLHEKINRNKRIRVVIIFFSHFFSGKLRPKKDMCVYCHMSKKSRVGRSGLIFFFFYYRQNRKQSFPKFPVK